MFLSNTYYCSECLDGFYLKDLNPNFLNSYSNCSLCDIDTLFKEDKFCKECSKKISHCQSCNSSTNCLKCEAGYFLRRTDPESFDFYCDICNIGGKIDGKQKIFYYQVFFLLNLKRWYSLH